MHPSIVAIISDSVDLCAPCPVADHSRNTPYQAAVERERDIVRFGSGQSPVLFDREPADWLARSTSMSASRIRFVVGKELHKHEVPPSLTDIAA
jgi:hypothetical protein